MGLVKDANGIPLGALVCVRVPKSHRKRQQFLRQLGRKPEYLYSFHFEGHFTWLNGREFQQVTQQPKHGVRRARIDLTKLLKCW